MTLETPQTPNFFGSMRGLRLLTFGRPRPLLRLFSSSWKNRADLLVQQAQSFLHEEKPEEAENLLYEALRSHAQHVPSSRDTLDLMRHITVVHLARFGTEQDSSQLEKARSMQSKMEQLLESTGDWPGLVEAIIRRGRQNEALFQQTQEEMHLTAAEEAFRSAVDIAERRAVRGEVAIVARLYLAQRLSERSEEDEALDKETKLLLNGAANHVRDAFGSKEQLEMMATM